MSSSDDEAWSDYLERARDLAEQVLRADDPYDLGLQFMGETLDVMTIGEYAGSMYCLWGALTDWVELKPDEEARAFAEMARAAREWLALDPRDSDAVRRYFDYWLYDVCGYERPSAQPTDASGARSDYLSDDHGGRRWVRTHDGGCHSGEKRVKQQVAEPCWLPGGQVQPGVSVRLASRLHTGQMSEITQRTPAVVSRAAGNTVGPAVAALCSMAGVAFGHPELAPASVPIGALAGSVAEEAVNAAGVLWQQRRHRVERFAAEAETSAGVSIDQLLEEAVADPAVLEMLARATEAAARSLDEAKIDLLARIFVSCVYDTAKVDEAILLVEALRQLEAPHMRLLAILAKPGPHLVPARPTEDRPRTPENMARIPTWRVEDILNEDAGSNGAFDALVARLYALGLVYDEGSGRLDFEPLWFLTALGRACVQYLGERGSVLR